MKRDPIEVIEAAYRPATTDGEWLDGIARAAHPLLDRGLGLIAYLYQLSPGKRVKVWSPVGVGCPEGWQQAWQHTNADSDPELLQRAYAARPFATASSILGPAFGAAEVIREHVHPFGIRDFLGINATDPTGQGCLVCVPLPRVSQTPRRGAATWTRLAAHIAAGFRIRRLEAVVEGAEDAILDPRGKVAHAHAGAKTGAARAALRGAVLAIERARGALRTKAPAEAIDIWQGLVAGQWSLVDRFDRDGRRYLVARRNDPATGVHRLLTVREAQVVGYAALGHSNKLIGYELGLSPSAVAMHLARASAKLGLTSRVALIRAFGWLASAAGPGARAR